MLRNGQEEDSTTQLPDLEDYGLHPDGPIPDVHYQQVEVPDTLSPLSESGEQRFLDAISELKVPSKRPIRFEYIGQ